MSFLFSRSSKKVNVYGDLRLSSYERPLYDTLWKQANPQGAARIGATQAIEFLNLSGISPAQLAAVFEITAINERSEDYYDRNAFDAALRLIGHAQKGLPPTVALLTRESRPTFNPANQYGATAHPPTSTWPPLPPSDMKTYRKLFRSLEKENKLLKYDIVLQLLLKTGHPTATLANILALVDRQKRAALDEDEFVMAMYFVMCLKANANLKLPSTLPAEIMETCGVKPAPSPSIELNYFNVLFNSNPNPTERERELLGLLEAENKQREQLQKVYLAQMLENSRNSEQRFYQQQIDQNRATQEQLMPLLTASGLGSNQNASTFANGYNNALKQQSELLQRMIAINNPIPQSPTTTQAPTNSPPPYSAHQPGTFASNQIPAQFSPQPTYQQQYPQYPQYQPPLQQYPPLQQPVQAHPQQYNPYIQYAQQGHPGSLQYHPPPPQGNPQYQQSAPGQSQQPPLSPGHPQQLLQSPGNPQYQQVVYGNPQNVAGQGQPFLPHQQQQPLLPGNPQQFIPPRHPQMYSQPQVDPLNAPLPPTPTSPVGPPLPSRAPQDRNDYSTTASTTSISSTPPPLPSRPGQQSGRPQEILSGRDPQFREPEPVEASRLTGAPQLR